MLLIAATDSDLAAEVRAGRFRSDVYHRVGAHPLQVPPLPERGGDVLLLAGEFLKEQRVSLELGNERLDVDSQQPLRAHAWPGNVCELQHVPARAALRGLGRHAQRPNVLSVGAENLGLAEPPPLPAAAATPAALSAGKVPLRQRVQAFERQGI